VPFISRVRIKNYKSIASCDVRLGPLTILGGLNGLGKSNFLDALAFMTRALATTVEEATDERGGLDEILRRVPDQARSFSIGIEAGMPWWRPELGSLASYEFELGPSRRETGFEVIREEGRLPSRAGTSPFRREGGSIIIESHEGQETTNLPPDRLFSHSRSKRVSNFSSGLSRPRFYNFNMETLRRPQPSATRPLLRGGGEALGDVIAAR